MITLVLASSKISCLKSEILILDSCILTLKKKITRQVLSHYSNSFVISKLQSYGIAVLLNI